MAQFKCGNFSTCDAPRPGRPKTVTIPEIVDQIQKLILEDRWISAKSIAEQLDISHEQAGLIIYEDLDRQHSSSPCLKKFQVQKSTGKVLASIFWDQDNILLNDFLPKGQTINAEYYSSLLVQLKDILKEKRHGKVTKGVLFFHDNGPDHRALATQKKLAYLGFQCLDNPPYSPDLATLDYHLFPGLKKTIERSPFFI